MEVRQVLSRMMLEFDVSKFKDLALKLGVSENTIDVWKRRKNIPEKNLLKCVHLTDCDYNWLLTGDKKEVSHSVIGDNNVNIGNGNGNNVHINISQFDHKDDIKEIIELLRYAPSGFLDTVKDRLKQFKELSEI